MITIQLGLMSPNVDNIVRLPFGRTGYHLFGPAEGVKIVLVHGLSTPSLIWHRIAPFLAEHGFHVLIYDLIGRGYSEAPGLQIEYTPDFYVTQLSLLMHHVNFTNAHILGLSMLLKGGGIIAAFAATFPQMVTQKLDSKPASLTEKLYALQAASLPGFQHAVSSSILHGPISGMEEAFKLIANTAHIKSLIIHGTDDEAVDFSFGKKIHDILAEKSELFVLEGADHDFIVGEVYYEQTRQKILEFLSDSQE
ncbi:hypothetical protein Clacol_008337 [Clathrus columnatus]|uniref:AB hydrolase-1 domain-containing protein n=1 Tax=Clathrus columnatus TaxID=1419009 RepID=A0AAV5AQA9_9AGAM|nr:hypothetical protein Clacol_008337 [Clathrus columnatus]